VILWLLNYAGAAGITMPWGLVYIDPKYWRHRGLRRHELIHLIQIRYDGPIRFTVLYLFYLVRYGYWDNPYEVEAYHYAPLEKEV